MTVWHVTFLILIDSQMEILATQLLLKVQSPWERYELEIEIQDSLVVTAMGLNEVTKGLNITEEKIIKPCRVINYVKRCCIVGPSFPPSLFPPPFLPPSLPHSLMIIKVIKLHRTQHTYAQTQNQTSSPFFITLPQICTINPRQCLYAPSHPDTKSTP